MSFQNIANQMVGQIAGVTTAGKRMSELATKYDPYVKAQKAAEDAYKEAETRFTSVSEQRDIMEKRMQILKGQKEQAYKTIETLYDGGNK